MAKSASSFATQITLGLVRSYCSKNNASMRDLRNYFETDNPLFLNDDADLDSLIELILKDIGLSNNIIVVIKLHRACTPYVASLIESKQVLALSTYRDPRDIALSILDASRIDEEKNKKRFTKYKTIADTVEMVDYQIASFKTWAVVKNIELISFDNISKDPSYICNRIASRFALPFDEDVVQDLLLNKKSNIWEFNKGVSDRWVAEFSPDDVANWFNRVNDFEKFLQSVMVH